MTLQFINHKIYSDYICTYDVTEDGPTPPPRKFRKEDLYESLPASLKQDLLVKSKIETDEEKLQQRQELTRSKSPAELSEIKSIDDFPIPTFVENLTKKKAQGEESISNFSSVE